MSPELTPIERLLSLDLHAFNETNRDNETFVYPTFSPHKLGSCKIATVEEHRTLINDAIDSLPEHLIGTKNEDGSIRYIHAKELFLLSYRNAVGDMLPGASAEHVASLVLTLGFATGRLLPVVPRFIWPQLEGMPLIQIRERNEPWVIPQLRLRDIYWINALAADQDKEVMNRLKWLLPDDASNNQMVQAYAGMLPDILFWIPSPDDRKKGAA